MSVPDGSIEVRCTAHGACCSEVSARLIAADTAKYELGLDELADRLRAQAARFAEVHGHGAPREDGSR